MCARACELDESHEKKMEKHIRLQKNPPPGCRRIEKKNQADKLSATELGLLNPLIRSHIAEDNQINSAWLWLFCDFCGRAAVFPSPHLIPNDGTLALESHITMYSSIFLPSIAMCFLMYCPHPRPYYSQSSHCFADIDVCAAVQRTNTR